MSRENEADDTNLTDKDLSKCVDCTKMTLFQTFRYWSRVLPRSALSLQEYRNSGTLSLRNHRIPPSADTTHGRHGPASAGWGDKR